MLSAIGRRNGSMPCCVRISAPCMQHRAPNATASAKLAINAISTRRNKHQLGKPKHAVPNKRRRARGPAILISGWSESLLGCSGFAAAGACVFLLEAINAAGGINQLLAAGEERVAGGADFHADIALVRRPRLEHVAARADHVH